MKRNERYTKNASKCEAFWAWATRCGESECRRVVNSLELNTNRFFSRIVYAIKTAFWRDVRVVDGAILERLCTETYRGFESPSLRNLLWIQFWMFRASFRMLLGDSKRNERYDKTRAVRSVLVWVAGMPRKRVQAGWSEQTRCLRAETESPSLRSLFWEFRFGCSERLFGCCLGIRTYKNYPLCKAWWETMQSKMQKGSLDESRSYARCTFKPRQIRKEATVDSCYLCRR